MTLTSKPSTSEPKYTDMRDLDPKDLRVKHLRCVGEDVVMDVRTGDYSSFISPEVHEKVMLVLDGAYDTYLDKHDNCNDYKNLARQLGQKIIDEYQAIRKSFSRKSSDPTHFIKIAGVFCHHFEMGDRYDVATVLGAISFVVDPFYAYFEFMQKNEDE